MKLATYSYVPGHNFGQPRVFMDNLKKFQTTYPVVTFSHEWPEEVTIQLKQSPEILKTATDPYGNLLPWAISAVVWWTAVRIAASQEVDYMLYLEPDCRVGRDHWDRDMFQEFFTAREDDCRDYIMGGSIVFYAPFSHSGEFARKWFHWYTHQEMALPCPIYGGAGPGPQRTLMYPNGALGIYNVKWLAEHFNLNDTCGLAKVEAWDILVAMKAWEVFGPNVFEAVCHLNKAYSGCGDRLNTEEDRMGWLRSGKFAAVHQVKTPATV